MAATLSINSGVVDGALAVSGTEFAIGRSVTLYVNGEHSHECTTDQSGNFACQIPVQALTAGTYQVRANDGDGGVDDAALVIS